MAEQALFEVAPVSVAADGEEIEIVWVIERLFSEIELGGCGVR